MEKITIAPFTDLPIQYKQINYNDFADFTSDKKDKTIITPDKNGFITDELYNIIDLEKKDTTIINACVGQGKSTAILRVIEKLLNNKDYVILLITPFKSLISQYKEQIIKFESEDNIFDYRILDKYDYDNSHIIRPVQLLSVNALLGNAGQIAMKQKETKRNYIKDLIAYCENNNKRVVFIYDEIHDAIHNFKQELVHNIYKWQNVTHKIIVSSATFNEASKVVIKHFGEITDKKVNIIESKRIQVIEKLSDLYLCFYDSYNYDVENQFFKELILNEIATSSKINILSYSKKLAKNIYNSSIGAELKKNFGNLKLCIADVNNNKKKKNKNTFNNDSCNIGTNFKTGINIEDENSSLFIILPPKSAYINQTNKFGIFNNGIFTLTQAIARPRKKSKIFIITPSPDKLIGKPNSKSDYYFKASLGYLPFELEMFQSPFYNINQQDKLSQIFYYNEKENLKDEIEYVEKNNISIKIKYPDYESFKLFEGERYYRTYFDIFGKNLSNYIYWAALNNQFVNCKIKGIIKTYSLFFENINLQQKLNDYYLNTYFDNGYFNLKSDRESYFIFRASLFSNSIYYKENEEFKRLSSFRNSTFEKNIITFIQKIKKQNNIDFLNKLYPNGLFNNDGISIAQDFEFNINDYLRIAISHSVSFKDKKRTSSDSENRLINAYQSLYKFKKILLEEYTFKLKNGNLCLPITKNIALKEEHKLPLMIAINDIIKFDIPLKSFSFLQKKQSNIGSIYSSIKDIFFKTKLTSVDFENGKKVKYEKILVEIELPNVEDYLNLIYDYNTPWLSSPSYTILP